MKAIATALGVSEVWLAFGEIVGEGGESPPLPIDPILLTVDEMYQADALAVKAGISGLDLMEAAGAGIMQAIIARWPSSPVLVLCGPGNNGGDGFVVARLLREAGWDIRLALLGNVEKLTGDAAVNAARWEGPVLEFKPGLVGKGENACGLVVDAVFGAGLSRPITGMVKTVLEEVAASGLPVIAVDVPSGIDGDTGACLGFALGAELTVTFFRRKPGHLLLPGRQHCGQVVVVDIGTPEAVLDQIRPQAHQNCPSLWGGLFPRRSVMDHKYVRGHVVVLGGDEMTGAARLAARGALRAGAGLVTIVCPESAVPIYALGEPGVLNARLGEGEGQGEGQREGLTRLLADERKNLYVLGPGNGVTAVTKARVMEVLETGRPCVLDADALTVFADDVDGLAEAISGPCVITPHEGEFARLFGPIGEGPKGERAGKLGRVRAAAARLGCVVLLKGADTVIADADGRGVINTNAPPILATAGAGDVLAGFIGGLMAQSMSPFAAACAGVWLHGECANEFGPGLIAEDLPEQLPAVLRRLFSSTSDQRLAVSVAP
ncbi:MAG: NAD(P)H-hydrate dehydratase [Rhodospirillaceae bacterium]|nr:NAD(P)H-hydrate dehydratase [Rhodospirillaceae bacterium]